MSRVSTAELPPTVDLDSVADRWLHLRDPEGFDDVGFRQFESGCRLWLVFARACIAEKLRLDGPPTRRGSVQPDYHTLPPTLSPDRRVATLPVYGEWNLGSRADFENASAHLLGHFMPFDVRLRMQQGFTEDIGEGPTTSWREFIFDMQSVLRSR